MKFARSVSFLSKYILLIFAIFSLGFVHVSKISAQTFPFFDFSNLNNFNFSNILDFADDFIPGISDVTTNLPSDPASILSSLTNGIIGNNVLEGNDFISTLFQITNNKNPDNAMPDFLSKISETLPADVQSIVTSFNPQTGLLEIIGAVVGKNTFFDSLLEILPNRKYVTQNQTVVTNNTGYTTPQCTCSCSGRYLYYKDNPNDQSNFTFSIRDSENTNLTVCSADNAVYDRCINSFIARSKIDAGQKSVTWAPGGGFQCHVTGP